VIGVEQLIACGIQPTQARQFAPVLDAVFDRFEINTRARRAAFIAQTMHESTRYTRLEENLWYTSTEAICNAFTRLRILPYHELYLLTKNPKALATAAYGDRNGNRGADSGDGWTYRGSGLMGLTGLDNFRAAAKATGRDYVEHPEWVRTNPEDAALSAGWFWSHRGCNELIDRDNFRETTRRINGGYNGASERLTLYRICFHALRT
jgi:putative chitinase